MTPQPTLVEGETDATETVADADAPADETVDGPAWTPTEHSGTNRCANCGAHVTTTFARVFSDNDGTVHRCRQCPDVESYGELHYRAHGGDHPGYQIGGTTYGE